MKASLRLFLCSTLLLVSTALSSLPLHRDSLPNGLIVITCEDNRLAIVDIALVCRSGHDADPLDRAGLAFFTAQMLTRGTRTMSADSFAAAIEFLGARVSGTAAKDNSSLSGRFLSRDFPAGLDLLAEAVLNPAFDSTEAELVRQELLAGARHRSDFPSWQVIHELDKLLFPDHPFSTSLAGDTTSLAAIGRTDLVAFHRRHYLPNNCFIVVVGDIKHEAVLSEVNRRFGQWQRAEVPVLALPEPSLPPGICVRLITRNDLNQTYIALGHPGISMSDSDMLAARLGSYILGGSALSSRLGIAVREKAGLAYDVRCWFERLRVRSAFYATVQTSRPDQALRLMIDEISAMRDSGPTGEEVSKARSFYTGSFPLNYSANSGKLREVINLELYGLGLDWLEQFSERIRAITDKEIRQAMASRLFPERCYIVIIGNVKAEDLKLTGVTWL